MRRNPIPMLGEGAGPTENPWEVHSDSGLEGVFADPDDAAFHADELRRDGVSGVRIDRRHRRPLPASVRAVRPALQNPVSEEEWLEMVEREDRERRARLERTGPTPEQIYDRFHADRAAGIHHGERRGERYGNPSSRLFAGVYPTGVVYADREREVDGDYKRVAFLPYSSLRLQWSPGPHPAELRAEVEADAAAMIARRGQPFEVSSSGQTVILGGVAARPPGAPPQYYAPQGRPPGVPNPKRPVSELLSEGFEAGNYANAYESTDLDAVYATIDDRRSDAYKAGFVLGFYSSYSTNEINDDRYDQALATYGQRARRLGLIDNPAGLTAKGERMYEHIKAGYGRDPRAAEIASRTVAARSKEAPGLRRKKR